MIGPTVLSKMKPSAFLINTARGGLVDQALLAALKVEKLQVLLLTYWTLNLQRDESLITNFDNLLVTPHNA